MTAGGVGDNLGYRPCNALLLYKVLFVKSLRQISIIGLGLLGGSISLAVRARRLLEGLGDQNISIKVFNGTLGWKEESPFDRIIVTAGAPEIPAVLVEQLTGGGRLIIPVGDRYSQMLTRVEKRSGEIIKTELFPCIFVPLIGEHGWEG